MIPDKEGVYSYKEYCCANDYNQKPNKRVYWAEEREIDVYQGPPNGPIGLCVFLDDYGGGSDFYSSHIPVDACGLEFIKFLRELD